MTLDEAFDLLGRIYTESQSRDLYVDPEMIEAFQIVVAAHPEVRPGLTSYWHSMKYLPDLTDPEKLRQVQACHPIMRTIFRRCRRPGYG